MNNDRITALEQQLAAIQAEIEQLKKADESYKEVKPWRALPGGTYYSINWIGEAVIQKDIRGDISPLQYKCGNYYRTRELAEQDAKELALRGRVRQLRDALCEGYQFINGVSNWIIYFDTEEEKFYADERILCNYVGVICFDTKEHAQTACDILNAEMGKESGGKP